MDEHFRTAPFEENIPVMLGLTGVWNTTFLGYPSLAILPYTQALSKLAPHIQQARSSLLVMPQILVPYHRPSASRFQSDFMQCVGLMCFMHQFEKCAWLSCIIYEHMNSRGVVVCRVGAFQDECI